MIIPILISVIFILSSVLIIIKLFNFGLNSSDDDVENNIDSNSIKSNQIEMVEIIPTTESNNSSKNNFLIFSFIILDIMILIAL